MKPFPITTQDLIIKDVGQSSSGRTLYELIEDLEFSYKVNGGEFKVSAPKGFVTDFATIPRFLWPIFPPNGKYARAAVIHDYLYRLPGCSRFLADAIFREVMYQLGVGVISRLSMYYAVRLIGWAFRQTAKNDTELLKIT